MRNIRAMASPDPRQIPVLALVGGVGCGKSAVAARCAAQLRAAVVDADTIGHDVLRQQDVISRLVEAFGAEILDQGEVNRSVLARRVFGETTDHDQARLRLESVVHPVMREEFLRQFEAARQSPDVDLIVFDAAILLESGWTDHVDVVAFVDVPFEVRLQRVAEGRGWTADELRRREASQWPLDRKRAAANVVIDNSGPVEAAGRQLEDYLRSAGWLPSAEVNSSTHQLVGRSNLN
jgi:dephospho-CoA kinase